MTLLWSAREIHLTDHNERPFTMTNQIKFIMRRTGKSLQIWCPLVGDERRLRAGPLAWLH
jgi:hypothetical protein